MLKKVEIIRSSGRISNVYKHLKKIVFIGLGSFEIKKIQIIF